MRGDGKPRAHDSHEKGYPEEIERPRYDQPEDSARTGMHGERESENLRPDEIEYTDDENPADDDRCQRPQRSTHRISAGTHHFTFDRLENGIDSGAREARDRTEQVHAPRPHQPVENAERGEDSRGHHQDEPYSDEQLVEQRHAGRHRGCDTRAFSVPTRNASLSAASSICFVVGLPAPCPALVSIRISVGAEPA